MTHLNGLIVLSVASSVVALTVDTSRTASVASVLVFAERDGRSETVRQEDISAVVGSHVVRIQGVETLNEPASIMLLVDLSWSTTRGDHPQLHKLFDEPTTDGRSRGPLRTFPGLLAGMERALLPWLLPTDRLFVGSFAGRRQTFSSGPASDPSDRVQAFKEAISPEAVPLEDWLGAAPIWDAVASAAVRLTKEQVPRAIVLVTDGESTGNRISLADSVRVAVENGVPVHIVCSKSWWDAAQYPPSDTLMRLLADQTGGLFRTDDRFNRLPWDKPAKVFGEVIAAIHGTVQIQLDVRDVPVGIWPLEVHTSAGDATLHAPKWIVRR